MSILSRLAALTVVPFVVLLVWRWSFSAPRYFDAEGNTLWKKTMEVVVKKSLWPYKTVYTTNWNGITVSVNGVVRASNRWFEIVLWNGQGVESIEVTGVDTNQLIYPSNEDPGTLRSDLVQASFSNNTQGGRYFIVRVKPPEGETKLKIVVTDVSGNVTSGTVVLAATEV